MKKRNWLIVLTLVLALLLPMQGILAEAPLETQAPPVIPVDPEFADELQLAMDALQAHTPGAVVDYAVRERDDGRYEWDLFFTLDGQLGQAEISEDGYEVRKVKFYEMPLDGLKAADAMAALTLEKGEITIIDLELDRDDGSIRYEGEASLGDKRYEFEISITGSIIEWERD